MTLEQKAYQIPLDHRQEVLDLKSWLYNNTTIVESDDRTRYIFELYTTYINLSYTGEPWCAYCRQNIKRKFKRLIEIYETNGIDPA